MSISSTKIALAKAKSQATLLMEDKLLYVLQSVFSVQDSYNISRAILNANVPFDDLEELIDKISEADEDYETWEDEEDYA